MPIKKQELANVVRQIIKSAMWQDIPVGKVKVIKLVYLAEIESIRAFGERLTEIEWKYLHYGPYSATFEEVWEKPDIKVSPIHYDGAKTWEKISFKEKPRTNFTDKMIARLLDDVVRRWAALGIYELLDKVYFETPPMRKAKKPGEVLDFSGVKTQPQIRKWKITNKAKLREIQRKAQEHLKKYPEPKTTHISKFLAQNLGFWDKESKIPYFKGKVIVKPQEPENDT